LTSFAIEVWGETEKEEGAAEGEMPI